MALSFNDILLPRDDACFVRAKVLGGLIHEYRQAVRAAPDDATRTDLQKAFIARLHDDERSAETIRHAVVFADKLAATGARAKNGRIKA
jgi:hypothetical protein